MAREQRRLAAILAADMVGFSRAMGRDEAGTLARLKEHRSLWLEPALARNGGRLVKLTGDGALAEFASAVDALHAAIEMQQAGVEWGRTLPEDQRIVFRVGLHLGDVIVDGEDLYGDGVNIAARLESAAPPGGIVVSRAVREAVQGRLKAELIALGELSLKNIERPIRAFRVEWNAADWPASDTAPLPPVDTALPALPDKPSIAVLPFQNIGGDPEQEYFVDGLVEDVITALSRISAFFVIARNSSFTYKGRAVDLRQVGRELGVRYVLEGSVRKAGEKLRITGQLIDTADGRQIWADRFDGAVADLFELQDSITASVVAAVEPKVQQAEIKRAQAKPTGDLGAYDLYLRACAFYAELAEQPIAQALALLERAVASDPRFATAHGLIASCCWMRLNRGWGLPADCTARGLEAAERAAECGRDDPRGLAAAAYGIARFAGRMAEALGHMQRALELNPDSVHVRRLSGYTCYLAGEHGRAIEHFRRAMQLSPRDPWAFDAYAGIALPYLFTGRAAEALVWADKALLERPMLNAALRTRIAAAALAGRPDAELRQSVDRLRQMEPKVSLAGIAARMGALRPADLDLYIGALRQAGVPE